MGAGALGNLHCHSHYSDGRFSPLELVSYASRAGLAHFGLTDHFETTKVPRALRASQLDEYVGLLHDLDSKFSGSTKVYAGVEIDTSPDRTDLPNLPFDGLNRLDFILLEYVNDDEVGGSALDDLEWLIEKIKVPCGLAHTDLSRVFDGVPPEALAERFESLNLFVEVNTNLFYTIDGVHLYERSKEFFDAFRGRVRVTVGSDTHRTLESMQDVRRGYEFVQRHGLSDMLLFK
ncbi:MAG TPA: PHP domain-containing protein [Methanomassiliicoccales archaeon]|nr:PHP domain-containing protein [Methanomassiliicoccales archaeon]